MSRVTIRVSQEALKVLDNAAGAARVSREAVAEIAFEEGLDVALKKANDQAKARSKAEAAARKEQEDAELAQARKLVAEADAQKKGK